MPPGGTAVIRTAPTLTRRTTAPLPPIARIGSAPLSGRPRVAPSPAGSPRTTPLAGTTVPALDRTRAVPPWNAPGAASRLGPVPTPSGTLAAPPTIACGVAVPARTAPPTVACGIAVPTATIPPTVAPGIAVAAATVPPRAAVGIAVPAITIAPTITRGTAVSTDTVAPTGMSAIASGGAADPPPAGASTIVRAHVRTPGGALIVPPRRAAATAAGGVPMVASGRCAVARAATAPAVGRRHPVLGRRPATAGAGPTRILGVPPHVHHDRGRIDDADPALAEHRLVPAQLPHGRGVLGDLLGGRRALERQQVATGLQQRERPSGEPVQGCDRPRGGIVLTGKLVDALLRPAPQDEHPVEPQFAHDLLQERRASSQRLDQRDGEVRTGH